jgi:hypothetical protein
VAVAAAETEAQARVLGAAVRAVWLVTISIMMLRLTDGHVLEYLARGRRTRRPPLRRTRAGSGPGRDGLSSTCIIALSSLNARQCASESDSNPGSEGLRAYPQWGHNLGRRHDDSDSDLVMARPGRRINAYRRI